MKIAVLHWATSSVGGINTTLEAFRAVASDRGDTFHVLASDSQRTKRPGLFDSIRRVRGGDSYIWLDGCAPHHPTNWEASAEFLAGYDVVMTSFLCPHPTKAYGTEPLFLPLLRDTAKKRPLIGYIHDAYFDTYAEWGREVLALTKRTMICQKAYLPEGIAAEAAYPPFYPHSKLSKKLVRDPRAVLWTPQWKNIKGIHPFFDFLPELTKVQKRRVTLMNNGIEYYKLRLTPEWRERVGKDHFAPEYSGKGKAEFLGCLPLVNVEEQIQLHGFVCDFQGATSKYEAYTNGSYNHTILEAMYYGAVPVVHENMLKSPIAAEFLLPVAALKNYPSYINGYDSRDYPRKRAQEFVKDNFSAEVLYDRVFRGCRTARR